MSALRARGALRCPQVVAASYCGALLLRVSMAPLRGFSAVAQEAYGPLAATLSLATAFIALASAARLIFAGLAKPREALGDTLQARVACFWGPEGGKGGASHHHLLHIFHALHPPRAPPQQAIKSAALFGKSLVALDALLSLCFDAGDGAAKAALIGRCLAYALAVELLAARAEELQAALPR